MTIDGVVKLRMEEEGMGARSPISCYSTIRLVIIRIMIIINMVIDEEHDDGGEGMGTSLPLSQ